MRLPRDLSGNDLAKHLARFGYEVTRRTGSHMRLTTGRPTQHHITIPSHPALRIGTLAAIVDDVAAHARVTREELLRQLFG